MASNPPTGADSATPARPRILSGVQPSGSLHLGNYFGAIRQHIALQEEGECFYFIADYHALTTVKDAPTLRDYVQDVAVTYLALGLDPERTAFYRQSDVPEVTELAWLLATVTGMGLLERAHSYKEKVTRGISSSVGLFTYPVLMAADILAPQAHLVPVGQDQDQHVEMTRDMAQLFDNTFAKDDPVFTLPKTRLSPAPRVPGTTFEKGNALQFELTTPKMSQEALDELVAGLRAAVPAVESDSERDVPTDTEAWVDRLRDHAPSPPAGTVLNLRVARADATDLDSVSVRDQADGLISTFFAATATPVFLVEQGVRRAAKMSKSFGNAIPIFAEGKPLKKSVMGIETRLVELADPLNPQEDLVMHLFRLFADPDEVADMEAKYRAGGFGFGNAKKALLAKIDGHFAPHRERRLELQADPDFVEDVMQAGAKRARAVARQTVDRARAACGLD